MKKYRLILLAPLLLSACGTDAGPRPVEIAFVASLDGREAACGEVYEGVGAGLDTVELRDLRLYVHDVRLVDEDGAEVPVALEQDGVFQDGDVALLDFEDATAGCAEAGTVEVNDRIVGEVPDGRYVGLRFTVGVPFERNHANHALAASPLNLTAMFWSWQAGYKFLRVDGVVDDGGAEGEALLMFHLGSTACTADESGAVTACANENRPEIELMGFDPDADRVALDLGALLGAIDLGENATGESAGCMSMPSDTDCAGYFDALGLPFGGASAGPQRVFTVAP